MFAAGLKNVINGNIGNIGSSATEALTLSLMTSDYIDSVAIATDEYWASISTGQISTGTDYTPGGLNVAGVSLATTGNATLLLSSTDVVFTTTGSIAAWAGVVRASSYLVSFIDFDGKQESVDGTFRVNWASTGLIRFEVTT
jgi:hypothetical protein